MPHKSRKRKIIADYRRKLQTLSSENISFAAPSIQHENKTKPVVKPTSQAFKAVPMDSVSIKRDLKKTVILSVLAICIEFVLYFVSNS